MFCAFCFLYCDKLRGNPWTERVVKVAICPECRSYNLRRRKRDSTLLFFLSLVGQWPYACDNCGARFFLRKRYVRKKEKEEQSGVPVE